MTKSSTSKTSFKTRTTLSSPSRARRTKQADAAADDASFDLPSEDAIEGNVSTTTTITEPRSLKVRIRIAFNAEYAE